MISLYIGRLILTDDNNFNFHSVIENLGYGAVFLAGLFIGFGFTFLPAAAILIVAAPELNFWAAGILTSIAAFIGNYAFFRLIRISFEDEINDLSQRKIFRYAIDWIDRHLSPWARSYVLPIFAGILVATPLPDELGMAIVAACHKISFPLFSIVSFIFAAFGIFIILGIGLLIN